MEGFINNRQENEGYQIQPVCLPLEYQKCPLDHFLRLISRMLSSLIYMNDYKLRAQEMLHQQQIFINQSNNASIGSPDFNGHINSFQQNINTNSLRNSQNSPVAVTPGSVSADSHVSMGTPVSVATSNMSLSSSGIVLTRFHSKTPPEISVLDYLYRLTKFSSLDHTVLLATLSYIDLLMLACPAFEISSLTVHRFLLAATTVACKGLRDSFYTNEHYAKVGGVHVSELNILEQELLTQINYRILPRSSTSDLLKYELERKKFVVFPNELREIHNTTNSGYDLLTNIYQSMVGLVGKWETVIYVSDRLPIYFGPKEQQALLKFHRGMWSKDVNFVENSKHTITYFLETKVSTDNYLATKTFNDDHQNKHPNPNRGGMPIIAEDEQKTSERSVNKNIVGKQNHDPFEKRRKTPSSSIPIELLANYFNPEIFKQTQIYKKNEENKINEPETLGSGISDESYCDEMNNGIYKKKKVSPYPIYVHPKSSPYNNNASYKKSSQ